MRVYGEEFFLINAWMNFLSLLLASRLARLRFRPGRSALSAGLGAVYGVLAWIGPGYLRSVAVLLAAALLMAILAFGRRALRGVPFVATAGLLLSGCAELMMRKGAGTGMILALCGAAVAFVCPLLTRGQARSGEKLTLHLTLGGRAVRLPAFRDSGNLLRDGISGLPVIVAPEAALRPLLPPGVKPNDLSTLPKGWFLVRVKTAGGSRTLMCFHPERVIVDSGGRQGRVEAAVALSDFQEKRALLPDALFEQEEERSYASL